MKKLSPIKLKKIWGYENWLASTHIHGMQKDFFEFAGGEYPLLVKVIQTYDALSVQVHPNDEKAALYENARGKTECWYVLEAKGGAQIVYGLNGSYAAEELKTAIGTNRLEGFLRYKQVKAGDFIYIPSGTVHAIGGGIRLLEVQQSSDITYRLYDWGRGRECQVEKGISCILDNKLLDIEPLGEKFVCPYFSIEKLKVKGDLSLSNNSGCVALYFLASGAGVAGGEPVSAEDIFALKSPESIKCAGDMSLIKILPL